MTTECKWCNFFAGQLGKAEPRIWQIAGSLVAWMHKPRHAALSQISTWNLHQEQWQSWTLHVYTTRNLLFRHIIKNCCAPREKKLIALTFSQLNSLFLDKKDTPWLCIELIHVSSSKIDTDYRQNSKDKLFSDNWRRKSNRHTDLWPVQKVSWHCSSCLPPPEPQTDFSHV